MTVRLNPYLGFRDNAREAMEFYKDVFGGSLTALSYPERTLTMVKSRRTYFDRAANLEPVGSEAGEPA